MSYYNAVSHDGNGFVKQFQIEIKLLHNRGTEEFADCGGVHCCNIFCSCSRFECKNRFQFGKTIFIFLYYAIESVNYI